jgi:hypothetical protein
MATFNDLLEINNTDISTNISTNIDKCTNNSIKQNVEQDKITYENTNILFTIDNTLSEEDKLEKQLHINIQGSYHNEFTDLTYLDSSKQYSITKPVGEYILKPHQTTSLYYMMQLEKQFYNTKTVDTRFDKTINDREDNISNHYTNVGILCDKVGAGKSYSIMGLLSESKDLESKYLQIRNSNYGSHNITVKKMNKLNTNILLVPHSLIAQWSKYLEKSGLKYKVIQKAKDIYDLGDDSCKFKTVIEKAKSAKEKKASKAVKKPKTKATLETVASLDTETVTKPKKKITLRKKGKVEAVAETVAEDDTESVEADVESIEDDTVSIPEEKPFNLKEAEAEILRIKTVDMHPLNIQRNVLYNKRQHLINNFNGNFALNQVSYQSLYNNPAYKKTEADLNEVANQTKLLNDKISIINETIHKNKVLNGKLSANEITSMNFAFLHHESTHNSYLTETNKDFLKYFGHINKTYVESLDVILVSDTQYNHMALFFTRDNYTVNRIIVDECNSIKGSQLVKIESVFKWFITSSISSIMTCDGWLKKEITSPQGYSSYTREKSIMSTGFIFDNISEIYRNIKENFKIFLINNPEYVEQSTQLPEMLTYIIICKNNVSIQVLAGIVSYDIMNMLFAGDIDGIVSKLDVVVGDETNIIAIVTQKYKDELNCKEYELKTSLANPKYKADAETIGVINRRHAIADLKHKIACIEERVKTVESCPICFDDFTNPCITPCCNNKFCFDCMTMALNNKNSCPSCRAELSVFKLMLLSNKKKEIGLDVDSKTTKTKAIEQDPMTMSYPQHIELLKTKSIDFTKYENMDKIFELNSKNDVKKYLIFTEYESTLNTKITSMLDKWELTYGRIKGTTATITKQIENYKKGNTNVLLINSKFFGSGMNLENTSDIIIIHKMQGDIEMQAIGRAHRFGRVENLRVWKLYYENEK